MSRRVLALSSKSFVAACALLVGRAFAGDGGFDPGKLFLQNPALTGLSSVDGALIGIDPLTGAANMLVDQFATPSFVGACAYDRFRDRILFSAKIGSLAQPLRLYSVDAFGNPTPIGFNDDPIASIAPAHDGRIYLRRIYSPTGQIQFLDASNNLRTLLDAAGTAPFVLTGSATISYSAMVYHETSNALLVATGPGGFSACSGGAATGVTVRRLPLSADGTRVIGPISCNEFDVSPSGETIVGFSFMSNGHALLVVDTNTNSVESRMLEVDPDTLAITPFASNGNYIGAAATSAGTWSTALDRAVILDSGSDVLRSFGKSESGVGTIVPSSIQPSSVNGSGEAATLIEIPTAPCLGQLHGYGVGKAGKGGFVPALGASGCPIPGGTLTISLGSVVGGANGMLFVGTAKAAQPFAGGTLLVFPTQLALPLSMPGAIGVAGDGNVSFPATLPDEPALSGMSLFVQGVFADSAASAGAALSAGLEITLG